MSLRNGRYLPAGVNRPRIDSRGFICSGSLFRRGSDACCSFFRVHCCIRNRFVRQAFGVHINPAVTVANALAGTFKRELTVPYVAFQVLGACLAGLSLKIVFGSIDSSASLGSTKLAVGITPVEGFAMEFLGTFVLATSALCASSFIRNPTKQAIIVGATLFALIMLIGPLTGASFNPARSLGPSLFSGYFDDQILYWSAPILGAGFGGLIFGSVKKFHGRRKYLDIVCVCP